jgi:hypothetical protein
MTEGAEPVSRSTIRAVVLVSDSFLQDRKNRPSEVSPTACGTYPWCE